jgi:hypothetical protein
MHRAIQEFVLVLQELINDVFISHKYPVVRLRFDTHLNIPRILVTSACADI